MEQFNNRLKYAMDYRNIKQSDLCISTGIPKSAMSQYISGSFKPKGERTYLLAKALDVNEAWLMGYDVPMERTIKDDSIKNNKSAKNDRLNNLVMILSELDENQLTALENFINSIIDNRNKG